MVPSFFGNPHMLHFLVSLQVTAITSPPTLCLCGAALKTDEEVCNIDASSILEGRCLPQLSTAAPKNDKPLPIVIIPTVIPGIKVNGIWDLHPQSNSMPNYPQSMRC